MLPLKIIKSDGARPCFSYTDTLIYCVALKKIDHAKAVSLKKVKRCLTFFSVFSEIKLFIVLRAPPWYSW